MVVQPSQPVVEPAASFWRRHGAWVWKVLAAIPLAIIFSVFVYLILQPDWYRYNDNITFGVVGGPFCDFNDTEIGKQCHEELKDYFHPGFGIPALLWLAVGPAALLLSLNMIFMSVWCGYDHLWWSFVAQLLAIVFSGLGCLVFWAHMFVKAKEFKQPKEFTFQMKDPSFENYIYIYIFQVLAIVFPMIATFIAARIQMKAEVEVEEEEARILRDREEQRKKNELLKKEKDKKPVVTMTGDTKAAPIPIFRRPKVINEPTFSYEGSKTRSARQDPNLKDPSRADSNEGPKTREAREYLAKKQALKPPPSLKKKPKT